MQQQTAGPAACRPAPRTPHDTSRSPPVPGGLALTSGHSGCANEEVLTNKRQNPLKGLDELAATPVRLCWELGQMADATSLDGSSHGCGFVARSLSRLAARDPFDPRDDASLDALRGIIAADLASEQRGTEWRVAETHCNGDGPQGELRECRRCSAQGEELLRVQSTFACFLVSRNATLDRAVAERASLQFMTR